MTKHEVLKHMDWLKACRRIKMACVSAKVSYLAPMYGSGDKMRHKGLKMLYERQ